MKAIATILAVIGFGMITLRILDWLNIYNNSIVPDQIFGYGWLIIAGGLFLVGAILGNLFGYLGQRDYFCSQCDQYLGSSSKVCPRCGSNRYYSKKA